MHPDIPQFIYLVIFLSRWCVFLCCNYGTPATRWRHRTVSLLSGEPPPTPTTPYSWVSRCAHLPHSRTREPAPGLGVSIAWFPHSTRLIKLLLHSRWGAVHLFNSDPAQRAAALCFCFFLFVFLQGGGGGSMGAVKNGLKLRQLKECGATPAWAYFDDLLMCSNNRSPPFHCRKTIDPIDW